MCIIKMQHDTLLIILATVCRSQLPGGCMLSIEVYCRSPTKCTQHHIDYWLQQEAFTVPQLKINEKWFMDSAKKQTIYQYFSSPLICIEDLKLNCKRIQRQGSGVIHSYQGNIFQPPKFNEIAIMNTCPTHSYDS